MSDAGETGNAMEGGMVPYALRHPRIWFWIRAFAAAAAVSAGAGLITSPFATWPIKYFIDIPSADITQFWLPLTAVTAFVPNAIAARFAAEAFAEAWWKFAASAGLILTLPLLPVYVLNWHSDATGNPISIFDLTMLWLFWANGFLVLGLLAGSFWAKRHERRIAETARIARLRALRDAGVRPVKGLHLVRAFVLWSVYIFAASTLINALQILSFYLPDTRQLNIFAIVSIGWGYSLITLSFALALGAFIGWRERIDPIKLLIFTSVTGVGLALWRAANRALASHEGLRREAARSLEQGSDSSAQIRVQGSPTGIDIFDSNIWLPALMVLLGGALVLFIKSPPFQRAVGWSKRPPRFMRDD